jgi:hypothetical protein
MAKTGAPTIVWGPLLSATVMNYLESGKLRDQVHKRSPFFTWLRAKNRLRVLTGGERIKLPVMFEGSGNFKRYEGLQALVVTGYDGVTNAFYDWKQAATAVVISGRDKRLNSGSHAVRSLAKDKTFQAEATLGDNLATDAYSDGTASGSLQTTGLLAMVATTNTTGTYADIDFGENDKWRNQVITGVGNAAVNLLPNLRTLVNDCGEIAGVEGGIDGIFTTQTMAEALEALVVPAVRYGSGEDAELSNKPLYRGAMINWEAKCQTGVLYALNSNHMFMFSHRDADMTPSEAGMQNPINQDGFIMPILWQGNMATNLRSSLGKLTGLT